MRGGTKSPNDTATIRFMDPSESTGGYNREFVCDYAGSNQGLYTFHPVKVSISWIGSDNFVAAALMGTIEARYQRQTTRT